mgnify:CR=1 FL=1
MKNFHPTGTCPIRDVLCRLGDKWSMLVLVTLNANGTMRFSDIHKTIDDISQRMLTVTLRTLETDGVLPDGDGTQSDSACRGVGRLGTGPHDGDS